MKNSRIWELLKEVVKDEIEENNINENELKRCWKIFRIAREYIGMKYKLKIRVEKFCSFFIFST